MARGGHGLPEVSPGTTMPDPSTPSKQASPQRPFQGFQQCGWPAAILYPFGHPTLYAVHRTPMPLHYWSVDWGHATASLLDLSKLRKEGNLVQLNTTKFSWPLADFFFIRSVKGIRGSMMVAHKLCLFCIGEIKYLFHGELSIFYIWYHEKDVRSSNSSISLISRKSKKVIQFHLNFLNFKEIKTKKGFSCFFHTRD
jgi:hypothetical protein